MLDRKLLGIKGENLSKTFLEKKGYKILVQNFRTRYGEIDLIAEEDGDLVFIEVKLRQSNDYGRPYESVNKKKQQHIVKSALLYIKSKNLFGKNLRFDVISIGPEPGAIELIRSAFMAENRYTY